MQNMNVYDFLKLLKKWAWMIIAITMAACFFIGYISYFKLTPIYSNTSTILINDRGDNKQKTSITFNDVMLYEKLMGTYKDIIKSKYILNDVGKALSPPMTSEQLDPMIKVTSNANSQVFRITVENPDYSLATIIANQIAIVFDNKVKLLMTVDNVSILDSAELKTNPLPVKPNKLLNITVAFIFSLFISINIVLLIHLLDKRIRSEEDLSGLTNYPILGIIPNFNQKSSKVFYS